MPDPGAQRLGPVDREPTSLGVDHFRGDGQVVALQLGMERTGEAGGDDPGGTMAVDQDAGRAPGRVAAHPADRDRDDLAVELPLDHRHRGGVILPDAPQGVDQVADFHRERGHDPDVGRDRRRRHHAHASTFRTALVAAALAHRPDRTVSSFAI